ncbi:MAG: DnaJ family domain-containing protein [Pirellulales bacterium]
MANQRPALTDRAIQIIAENKTRAAIEAGEFDDLARFGKPAAIFDEPYDPHWWIRRKLAREGMRRLAPP